MTRIVTLGSEMFITAFRLQGIDGFIITSPSDFERIIEIIMRDESISIVLLEDALYFSHRKKMDKIKMTVQKPLFVEIPLKPKQEQSDIIADLIKKNLGIVLD